jgi:hypothetical protein
MHVRSLKAANACELTADTRLDFVNFARFAGASCNPRFMSKRLFCLEVNCGASQNCARDQACSSDRLDKDTAQSSVPFDNAMHVCPYATSSYPQRAEERLKLVRRTEYCRNCVATVLTIDSAATLLTCLK